ncbi:hypothetical protein D3C78_832630 [compost metagenome]
MRNRYHAQCRPHARRRQPAGVAVGQQPAARFHQLASRPRNRIAELLIFLNQAQRLSRQRRNKIFLP